MPDDFRDYVETKIREGVAEQLALAPWWCMFCGEGGNYDGTRPDSYWIPPKDHVCRPRRAKLRGIGA